LAQKNRLSLLYLNAQETGSLDSHNTFWLNRPAEFQASSIGQLSAFSARVAKLKQAAVGLQGPRPPNWPPGVAFYDFEAALLTGGAAAVGAPTALNAALAADVQDRLTAATAKLGGLSKNLITLEARGAVLNEMYEGKLTAEKAAHTLTRIGGDKWFRNVGDQVPIIKVFNTKRPLEVYRAAKLQPEFAVDFFRLVNFAHALAQVSAAVHSGRVVEGWRKPAGRDGLAVRVDSNGGDNEWRDDLLELRDGVMYVTPLNEKLAFVPAEAVVNFDEKPLYLDSVETQTMCVEAHSKGSTERCTLTLLFSAKGSLLSGQIILKDTKIDEHGLPIVVAKALADAKTKRPNATVKIGIDGAEGGSQTDVTMLSIVANVFLPAMRGAGLSATRPFLLFVDGHASHLAPAVLQLFRDNHVIVVAYPSHTSTWLQAADLGVMAVAGRHYAQLASAWMARNAGILPTLADKVALVLETIHLVADEGPTLRNAFAQAGMLYGRPDPLARFNDPKIFRVGAVYRDESLPTVTRSLLQHLFHPHRLIEAPGFTMLTRSDKAAKELDATKKKLLADSMATYKAQRDVNGTMLRSRARPDGSTVGVCEYTVLRYTVDVADTKKFMFKAQSGLGSLQQTCEVMIASVSRSAEVDVDDDEDDDDDDDRADVSRVDLSRTKTRGAAGRIGTSLGALLTCDRAIQVMTASELVRKADAAKAASNALVRAETDLAERSVTEKLKRLRFITDVDAARATVPQLTAFCNANAGLALVVCDGKAPAGNAIRAHKYTCVERVLQLYSHFAVGAGETGGHVHCRGCDDVRRDEFWQPTAVARSDGWLRCESVACNTWWCNGCVQTQRTIRIKQASQPGSYETHREVCVAAAAAVAAKAKLDAATPVRTAKKRDSSATSSSLVTPVKARARTDDKEDDTLISSGVVHAAVSPVFLPRPSASMSNQ
jgi:hypothetical protein